MKTPIPRGLFVCILMILSMPGLLLGQETRPAIAPTTVPAGPEVTLKGVMLLEEACVLKPAKGDDKLPVLFVINGPPDVTATLDGVMKDFWPGDSMDGMQARQFNEAFSQRLKYYITPGDLVTSKVLKDAKWGNPPMAVTGVVSEVDGKHWITPSKIEGATLKYPEKMLAPDKPIKAVGKNPLMLKVTDALSIKCILLPRGNFLFLKPFFVLPRWQDEYPRLITLTKPFYMAEIPVTQEMWDAVMPEDPSTLKDPQRPVRNVKSADISKFCKILSEKNGRTVRLPGEAEWEYAARAGTSNPQLDAKYKDQDSTGPGHGVCLPVKSKKPNAWGLYDMISPAFEMTRDKFVFSRKDATDPYDSCEREEAAGKTPAHWGRNTVTYHEAVGVGDKKDSDYGSTKFRVVVEATPEEIAEMEKAEPVATEPAK